MLRARTCAAVCCGISKVHIRKGTWVLPTRGYEEIIDVTKNPPDEKEELEILKKMMRILKKMRRIPEN